MLLTSKHHRALNEQGFSLLEMVIALSLLTVVLGVAVDGISQMMRRNTSESGKVDTVQETRDFVDQMVRDIHDVGFPPPRLVNGAPTCVGNANISCGLVSYSPTAIQYEGDLDGSGTVYEVYMQLLVPASGNCPCTLQRGVVTKAQALGGTLPTYFTEVNGVLNSGNGAGAATYPIVLPGGGTYTTYGTADVFDAYDTNAAAVATCTTAVTCSSIRSLQITANVVPNYMDTKTTTFPVYSITSKARLNN
jgi:prepilin-type N-terminal cleavage/methylation domain-containing protein